MKPIYCLLLCALVSCGRAFGGPLDFWTCSLVLTNAYVGDSMIFANGRFVVGVNGGPNARSSTLVSDDGVNWREVREGNIGGFCQGNGVIVGRDGSAIYSSPDGVSWIARRPFLVNQTKQLLFGQGRFVAQVGGGSVDNPIALWSSPDGIEWTLVSTNLWSPTPENAIAPRLAFVKDRWTTLDFDQQNLLVPLQSFDGLNFTPNQDWPSFYSVQHNGSVWVGVLATNRSLLAVSSDGTNWNTVSPNPNWDSSSWWQLNASGGRFFAIGGSANYFFESADGYKWTDHQVDILMSTKWDGWLTLRGSLVVGNNRAVTVAQVSTPATNSIGMGKKTVARFYVSQPLTNGVAPFLGMGSLPALKLESGTIGSGYHVESAESVMGPWERVATVFPTNFPFTFLAPDGDQRSRVYRAVVRD